MRTRRKTLFRSVAVALAMTTVGTACGNLTPLSTEEALERLNVATTKVYASDGSLIANLHGEINRDIVPLDEIPEHVQNAVIAIEDERFWSHTGLDLKSILRAAVRNVEGAAADSGRIQGGSTISQQLVKNLYFPSPERTLRRKVEEGRKTWQFEDKYPKRKILEMYLNTIYFGRGLYGVQTAAKSYFRKDTKDLSLDQAAFLAGLIHEPGRYDFSPTDPPDKRDARREAALARRNLVLDKMVALGFVSREEAEEASTVPMELEARAETEWKHPYFVDMILTQLGVFQDRCSKTGPDPRFDQVLGDTCAERAEKVYKGGLRIYTTLDPKAQEAAEEAVEESIPDDLEKLHASLAAVEPDTGYVRALVGGRDYYPDGCAEDPDTIACSFGKLNLALGTKGGGTGRQPGSSFKPFVLAAALERGVSLRSLWRSSPFAHAYPGGVWTVRNYEGSGGGSVSLVEATVNSVNASFAHVEIDGVGEGDVLQGSARVADLARRAGIPFETRAQVRERCGDGYGTNGCIAADDVPAIALGAVEVAPLDMASAYATLAGEGIRTEPTAIVRIADANGETIYEAEPQRTRVLPRGVALATTAVLQEVVERGTGTRARIDRPVAGKTGTAQQWRDAWFGGYVPQLAAVVWVGNPEKQEEMVPGNGYPFRVVGGSFPATIWSYFMTKALEGIPVERFSPPPSDFFVPKETPPPVAVVPDVLGLYRDDAVDKLRLEGFDIRETKCLQRSLPDGTVVKQIPAGGAEAAAGSSVELCVSVSELPSPEEHLQAPADDDASSGEQAARSSVPSVIGESRATAGQKLNREGFQMAAVRECDPSGHSESGRVWKQDPEGGVEAESGSTVTVWYNGAGC